MRKEGSAARIPETRSRIAAAALVGAVALALAVSPAGADRGRGGRGGHGGQGGRGGHGGHGGGSVVVASPRFYSPFAWDWYYGYGWGHPGYGYRPPGGLDPAVARAQGLGAFDLDVKPRTAEVWVDGRYIGLARDFDGYPAFLWLEEGEHTIALSKPGFATWEQPVAIDAGRVSAMRLALAAGPRTPPSAD